MTAMFLTIAIVASAFLGIQIIIMMFGGDMEFDSDMDVDASDGGGFLSIRSLTAFFGGFGWAGLAAKQADWSDGAALGMGIAVGVGMFVVVGFLFMQARKLGSDGNLDYESAVGKMGSVYIPIPPNRTGPGKVELTVSGRVTVVAAVSDSAEELSSKTRVRVIEHLGASTVLVERA